MATVLDTVALDNTKKENASIIYPKHYKSKCTHKGREATK